MLARQHRLRRTADINKVYSRGRSSGGQDLYIKSLSTGLSESRAVVVVGKKVSKKATIRNRIRRQLVAQLRNLWPQITPGYDIVVSVVSDISTWTSAKVKDQLGDALHRSNLITKTEKTHV